MARLDGRLSSSKLQGFKYFERIDGLRERLRTLGTEWDRAGNRNLFFDQYAALLILYYFNPTDNTLRGLQQFTTLEKVQRLWGVRPTSLGSLSEAARVFDPQGLEPIIAPLAAQAAQGRTTLPAAKEAMLAGLIAVDGSLLPALPRMAGALWQDATHCAAKMHVAFAVFASVPVGATVTAGNNSERDELRKVVRPGGLSITNRDHIHPWTAGSSSAISRPRMASTTRTSISDRPRRDCGGVWRAIRGTSLEETLHRMWTEEEDPMPSLRNRGRAATGEEQRLDVTPVGDTMTSRNP